MSEPTTTEPYVSRIDRRTALTWIGSAAAAGAISAGIAVYGPKAGKGAAGAGTPGTKGYGTDPNLLNPTIPWPRILTKAQLQAAALLCDFILPASASAPSASALGVPDFIDEWVSAPYPDQMADRSVVLVGMAWLEDQANHRHGVALLQVPPAARTALFQSLTVTPTDPDLITPHAFFRKFRSLTIGAYYTTDIGFKEIGYTGNVAMAAYPGPSPEVKAVLDRELKKLGL